MMTIMQSPLALLLLLLLTRASCQILLAQETFPEPLLVDSVKVPVVLGVMSACPDAFACETVFDGVLEQVSHQVQLSLSFIGRLVQLDNRKNLAFSSTFAFQLTLELTILSP